MRRGRQQYKLATWHQQGCSPASQRPRRTAASQQCGYMYTAQLNLRRSTRSSQAPPVRMITGQGTQRWPVRPARCIVRTPAQFGLKASCWHINKRTAHEPSQCCPRLWERPCSHAKQRDSLRAQNQAPDVPTQVTLTRNRSDPQKCAPSVASRPWVVFVLVLQTC